MLYQKKTGKPLHLPHTSKSMYQMKSIGADRQYSMIYAVLIAARKGKVNS